MPVAADALDTGCYIPSVQLSQWKFARRRKCFLSPDFSFASLAMNFGLRALQVVLDAPSKFRPPTHKTFLWACVTVCCSLNCVFGNL